MTSPTLWPFLWVMGSAQEQNECCGHRVVPDVMAISVYAFFSEDGDRTDCCGVNDVLPDNFGQCICRR